MKSKLKESRGALGPEEVARLGNVFDTAWSEITRKGLLAGRHNVGSLRDLVGQMIWAFHGRGIPPEEIPEDIVEILTEAASQHPQ